MFCCWCLFVFVVGGGCFVKDLFVVGSVFLRSWR